MNQGNAPKLSSFIFTLARRKGKSTRGNIRNRKWAKEDSRAQMEDKRRSPIIDSYWGATDAEARILAIEEKHIRRKVGRTI